MPFKRHNPGCPCCDEISSSSVPSSSSVSSSSSSSSISSSSVFNPCDCDEDSTFYIKIEVFGFATYTRYNRLKPEDPLSMAVDECCVWREMDYTGFNGTYFVPLVRNCPDATFTIPLPPGAVDYPAVYKLAFGTSETRGDRCGSAFTPADPTPAVFVQASNASSFIPGVSADDMGIGFGEPGESVLDPIGLGGLCASQPSGFRQYQFNPNVDCIDTTGLSGRLLFSIVGGPTP